MKTQHVKTIGKPAAVLAAFFAIAYSIFQLLAAFKVIPHPNELLWLFLPSLLLAFAFLITIICLHYYVAVELEIYTAIAGAFAVLYCAFVSLVYFTQIAVVIPQLVQGTIDETHILSFSQGSFMVAIDCLGYAFMSASTLFAAFAFKGSEHKWLYRSLLWSGLLTPVVLLAFFIPAFMFVGAIWMITMPMAMINSARLFGGNSNEAMSTKTTKLNIR